MLINECFIVIVVTSWVNALSRLL